MIAIKGFIENSLIEWEGKIVSIVFLPTCNLRCPYCHAPHLVLTPNELESIPTRIVINKLQRGLGWLDGVVVTGGEPTNHTHLDDFLAFIKGTGLLVRLDTNGTNPRVLQDLIQRGLLDCVTMDIKAPLHEEKYKLVAGVPCAIEDIRQSIHIIMESGIDYEFRTTICPSQLTEKDVEAIAREIAGAKKYILQSFKPNHCLDSDMLNISPYPDEVLKGFADIAGRYVKRCYVRGKEEKIMQRNW